MPEPEILPRVRHISTVLVDVRTPCAQRASATAFCPPSFSMMGNSPFMGNHYERLVPTVQE